MSVPIVSLEGSAISPEAELANFIAEVPGRGAVVSFVGLARPATRDGVPVTRLYLDHYPGMTERSLTEIAADALHRFDGVVLRVMHRYGEVLPNEPIVFVAAAADHRRSAFQAADYVMDRLKTEAAFWKREDTPQGSSWIEPVNADHLDRARWE